VELGSIVIASGGGGIPAYVMTNGHYEGVDAVIDKDLAAVVLGEAIGASELYILTDVPEIYLDFQSENPRPIRQMSVLEAEHHLHDNQFPPGSMGPKVQAALEFLQRGGTKVIITDIATLTLARKGEGGTTIYVS
jgi:carbamate kinase